MSASVHRPPVLLLTTLFLGIGLLACGGSDEATTPDAVIKEEEGPAPTAEKAKTALTEAVQAHNRYCVHPRAEQNAAFPITLVNPSSRSPTHQYQQLWVLQQVGLLDTTASKSTGGLPVHRFSMTRKGERTRYDIARSRGYQRMFCYGVPTVARIDSIKSIYNAGPNNLAKVWFAYRVENRRSWGDTSAVRNVFSNVPSLPRPNTAFTSEELLVQVDSAWVDRRLTGYSRPPEGPADSVRVKNEDE